MILDGFCKSSAHCTEDIHAAMANREVFVRPLIDRNKKAKQVYMNIFVGIANVQFQSAHKNKCICVQLHLMLL